MAGGGGRPKLLLAVCALSCASVEERPEGPIVDSFDIEGTAQLTERQVKKRLFTSDSVAPYWLPFFGREERFDQNAWVADQRRVERFYQAHGFYQARVVEEAVTPTQEGHVAVRMKVQEGGPTHVKHFQVKGLEPLDLAQRTAVLEKLPPRAGRVFLEEEWIETQRVLTERLQKLGYAGATLQARAEVDVATQTAELSVEVDPGQRYRFGPVLISNPDGKVDKRLIEDQVTSVIERGEWFTPEKLEEAQARVFKMNVFSAVKVTRAALDQQTGEVPVAVDVREASFQTLRAGGGFGGDPLRNEVRGSLLYEHRNCGGGTRRCTVRAKLGYALLASGASSGFFAFLSVFTGQFGSIHGPFGRLTLELEQPHFLSRALALQFTLEPSYTIEPAYRSGGASAKLALVWRPTSRITASASYSGSIYLLSAPVALGPATGQFVGCGLTCVLHNLEETIAWDRRDDLLEPHDGWYLGLAMQQGGNTLGSGGFLFWNFFRFLPEARFYKSFFDRRFTIAAKARLGFMFTVAGVAPIPVRFFSGGNEMRGFAARRLAPFDVVPRTDCDDFALDAPTHLQGVCPGDGEVLPVGGDALFDASLELRWNVWEDLTIATFVDTGYVTGSGLSATLFTSLNVAVGLGFRYRTPIGPIRLDVAVRLPVGAPLERAGLLRQQAFARGCFFGWGSNLNGSTVYPGSPESLCAFHVSIGEAF